MMGKKKGRGGKRRQSKRSKVRKPKKKKEGLLTKKDQTALNLGSAWGPKRRK